jgi:arabinogalactan endo-1,4-beta-galactosidase
MNKGKIFMLIAIIGTVSLSCESPLPSYPPGNEGTTEGLGGAKRPPALADYGSVEDLPSLTAPLPDDFIRGVDISNCYIIEQAGGVYYDDDGTPKDIIAILKDHGINYVRLRLWHNHQLAYNPGPYAGDGDNDMVKTRAIARRAKDVGMKFLLNFHYSDNWADPGRQQIPAAWAGYTVDQLVQAVYDYTFDTIQELKAAGTEPDMVQIGNEITPGMLKDRQDNTSDVIGNDNDKLARVLESGIQAARLAAPGAKIMLHLDSGGDVGKYNTWFDRFAAHNNIAATVKELDFDVIGLSWYPYYSSHKSLDDLDANIRDIRSRYGKEAVVAEHSWAWTIAYDGDELSNLFHVSQENLAAVQMTDGKGYVSASGIQFETRADGTKYLPASPENQAKVLRAVIDATASAGGSGVFWWAAEWIPAPGLKSNWDNQTLFDFNGKALPALSILGGLSSTAGKIAPHKPANFRPDGVSIDSVSLAWDAPYSADSYRLFRADSDAGPWDTPMGDAFATAAYTDTGLTPGTAYYYRVQAHNEHGWGELSGALKAETPPLSAPPGFRVSATNTNSIGLAWNAVSGATAYKIYHVQSSSAPADSAYTPLSGADNLGSAVTTYTHSGLQNTETHYYKISAVFGSHGEGPKSGEVHATTGAPPSYATVNMGTGVLDADFGDSSKATSSTASLSPTKNGNYDIEGLYVANDATNLYIALDFGSKQPSGYSNDRLIVLIDNTNSSAGGVNDIKVAQTQTLASGVSLEGYAMKIMNAALAGTTGVACNVSSWVGGDSAANWLYTPGAPADAKVVKFSIPLANIGSAVAGNTLRVFAAFSQGWSNTDIRVGDIIPANAVTSGGTVDSATIDIDMAQALSYTVK